MTKHIGAMRPNYLVTADDVGTQLSAQVLPQDDRNRKVLFLTSMTDIYHRKQKIPE